MLHLCLVRLRQSKHLFQKANRVYFGLGLVVWPPLLVHLVSVIPLGAAYLCRTVKPLQYLRRLFLPLRISRGVLALALAIHPQSNRLRAVVEVVPRLRPAITVIVLLLGDNGLATMVNLDLGDRDLMMVILLVPRWTSKSW